MLLSIVSVSTVCLALAYSGWDATDFPPGTDFTMTQDETFLQPQFDSIGLYGDRILKWLLFLNEDSDVHRDCCGMKKTLLQDEQLNDNSVVLITATGSCKWTYFYPQDAAEENPSHLEGNLQSDPTHTSVDTCNTDGAKISTVVADDVSDITLVNILRLKPVVIDKILGFIWSFISSNSRSSKDNSNHFSITDDTTSWFRTESVFTSYLGHLKLRFLHYWPSTFYLLTTDDQQISTTDDSCYWSYLVHLHLKLLNYWPFTFDLVTTDVKKVSMPTAGDYSSEDHHLDETNASGDDNSNVEQDSLALMLIQLVLAAIINKSTGKRRLRLPKGTTITPVLYSRGKYLELGLSKYIRHRPLPQVVFGCSSCVRSSVYNYNRPGLELTRRFNLQ